MGNFYLISSREYLKRANLRLRDGTPEAYFYAAFELRCGIEARMQEYLEVWDHISKRKKKGWRIAELSRNLEEAFRLRNAVVRWAVHDELTNKLILCFYHTPVTKKLHSSGEKLGNYLHSMKRYRDPDDSWWTSFRNELVIASDELRIANTGTLLGPPLMKVGTTQVDMRLEIPPGYSADELMKAILNQKLKIDVSYPKSLPKTIEKEAVIWKMDEY